MTGIDDAIGDTTIVCRWTALPWRWLRNKRIAIATIAAIAPMRIVWRVTLVPRGIAQG